METQQNITKVSADQVTTDTATRDAIDYYDSKELMLEACYGEDAKIYCNTSDDDLIEIALEWMAIEESTQGFRLNRQGVLDGLKEWREEKRYHSNRNLDDTPSTTLY